MTCTSQDSFLSTGFVSGPTSIFFNTIHTVFVSHRVSADSLPKVHVPVKVAVEGSLCAVRLFFGWRMDHT